MIFIGNDIVDLTDSETQNPSQRFIERVFSWTEKEQITRSTIPSRYLWAFWSAKEASFKVLKKKYPKLIFEHRLFEVDATNHKVYYEKESINFFWMQKMDYMHCLACSHDLDLNSEDIRFDIQKIPVDSDKSASLFVRSQLLDLLAKKISIDDVKITRELNEKNLLSPPYLKNTRGALTEFDISLSHHGQYVASAYIRRRSH